MKKKVSVVRHKETFMKKVKIVISEVSIVKYKVTITEKMLKLRDISCKPSKKKILCHNLFKIHLFHTKYVSNSLTYLLTYHLTLTDIKLLLNFIWSIYSLHNAHFL